jgi:hypothetical protein
MDQVRLNTIAIFVFVLTCSVLLGPWLNISPALPALAIVSVLGLVTFDALGFQGKGVTLFLDSFAQRSPVYKERILRHEAGHFLVAHLLEVPLTGYTLSAWEALKQGYPGQGGVMFDSPELERGNLSATLLDRYCTVWMAGGAAESLVYGTVEGGEDDLQKLRSTLTHLRLEWKSKQRSAVLQARDLLQSHWSAYEALVEAMAQRASTAECCQVIEHHRQETPAPSTF